jgi:hypothetical protein
MSRTYEVQEAVQLALAYRDPEEWFISDQIFVKQPVPTIKGKYRLDDLLAWYQNYDFRLGPDGYPTEVDLGDSFVEWATEVRGKSYPITLDDLKDYLSRGFSSADQYKQTGWEYLIHMALINKEFAAIAAIEASANYDTANLHVQGAGDFTAGTGGRSGLAWSNFASTPINDVDFLKRENKRANTIAFDWITLHDLMVNPQILDYGSVSASDRDDMSPSVSIRYLESIFKLKVVVSKSEAVTAATASLPLASQVKGPIWGDYIWVGQVNQQSTGPRMALPTWGKQYVYTPVVDNQGWIMTETIDPRAGAGVGKLNLDLGYYNQYKVYAKSYGQKLTGVQ